MQVTKDSIEYHAGATRVHSPDRVVQGAAAPGVRRQTRPRASRRTAGGWTPGRDRRTLGMSAGIGDKVPGRAAGVPGERHFDRRDPGRYGELRMRRRHFMLAPAAARFISQPRQKLGSAVLAAPAVPGTGRRGRAAGLGRAVLFAALAARGAGPDAGPQVLQLTPPGPVADGCGQAFIDAVRGRALAGQQQAAAVVLDLSAAGALDSSWCAVLVALNDSLRPGGTRLRLAGVPARLLPGLQEADVCQHIGADAIHPSVRSALLAIHAALPGPGLVTAPVRASLARCADDAGIWAD